MLIATTRDELRPLALSADAASGVASIEFRSDCTSLLVCATTSSTFERNADFRSLICNDAHALLLSSLEKLTKLLSTKFGKRLIFLWRFVGSNAAAMGTLDACAARPSSVVI
jgi:hypothetical protein